MTSVRLKCILTVSTPLAVAYLAVASISILNWFTSLLGGLGFKVEFIPGDPGLSLVMLTVGLTLTASNYYWFRGDHIKCLSTLTLGLALAVSAMIVQVLTSIAFYLDSLVVSEPMSLSELLNLILRVDSLLGYLAVPVLVASISTLKHHIKS